MLYIQFVRVYVQSTAKAEEFEEIMQILELED